MKKYDIGIIGGGASGIMAAITAAKRGKSVILIEKNPTLGRKILATGNGRCNLTNKNVEINRYYSNNQDLVKCILNKFDQHQTMEFFESLGLVLKEEELGRIFPRTNQASSVLKALEYELSSLNVKIELGTAVKEILKNKHWKIICEENKEILADKLIIASGGKAAHQLGSSGDGIYFAKKLGLKINPLFPALVPIETDETWTKEVQGLKITAKAEFLIDDKVVCEKFGDLLFTHYGLSGPAIMGQARFVAPFVGQSKIEVNIDTYPEGNLRQLDEIIRKIFDQNGVKSVKNALSGLVPASLIQIILKNTQIDVYKKAGQLSKDERMKIVKYMKKMVLTVKALRPFKEAQVSRGGVDLDEMTNNLESKKVKDLFLCGEILDVDADSGGFNLQWAWSSGYMAAHSAANS